jgi:hypothetical protein
MAQTKLGKFLRTDFCSAVQPGKRNRVIYGCIKEPGHELKGDKYHTNGRNVNWKTPIDDTKPLGRINNIPSETFEEWCKRKLSPEAQVYLQKHKELLSSPDNIDGKMFVLTGLLDKVKTDELPLVRFLAGLQ